MQVHKAEPLSGEQRARKLGLQSHRFYEGRMSRHAEEAVDYVKRKDRSYQKLDQWRPKKYYKTDAIKQLFDCPDQIERRNSYEVSVEEFVQKYQKTSTPLILRGCTDSWKVKEKWTHEYFYREYKDIKFKIGEDDDGYKLRVPFKYYLEYLVHCKDDSPLYLFESSLEDKPETRPIIENYKVPPYFKDDLFKLAGEKKRPPYRWFIMGPERSGTTVHLDPLMTSAWNASLAGHKRWVCFDPKVPKSIVKGKQFRKSGYDDEAINYFVEILPQIKEKYSREELGLIEFIQYPGETVYIPGGLWHAVINLDDTIAVTQNVMTHECFETVWRSTRCERRKFAKNFLQKLRINEPDLHSRAIALNDKQNFVMGDRYCKQSVSLSFTPSSSSSSSSSSQSSSKSSERCFSSERDRKNKVETKKRNKSKSNDKNRSRSRDNKRTRSEEKSRMKKR